MEHTLESDEQLAALAGPGVPLWQSPAEWLLFPYRWKEISLNSANFSIMGLGDERMEIALVKSGIDQASIIYEMQVKAFKPLLERYQDFESNCYLYEKLGYKRTEHTKVINDKMTIVFYEKHPSR